MLCVTLKFFERKSLSISTFKNFAILFRYFSLAYFIISWEMSMPTTSANLFWSFGNTKSTRTSPEPHPTSRSEKSSSLELLSNRLENSFMTSSASRFWRAFDFLYNLALFMTLEALLIHNEMSTGRLLVFAAFKYDFNKELFDFFNEWTGATIALFLVWFSLILQIWTKEKFFSSFWNYSCTVMSEVRLIAMT